ncbi:MAG: hypothetical protein ACYC9U_05895 [Nitrososphaerales archaeon]
MAFQRRRRSISQLSAIAMGVIVVILVAFGAYTAINFNSSANSGVTTDISTTQLGTTITTCLCDTTVTNFTSTLHSITIGNSSATSSSSSYVDASFNYATMPAVFKIGDYSFAMIYNGTYYVYSQNGTEYANTGFNFVLNVTSLQSGKWETVDFGWAPPAPQPHSLPTPQNATLFDGAVQMNWYYNTTGIFGTFLTISVLSPGEYTPTTTTNTNSANTTSSETCTPAATLTTSSTTETIVLCHTESMRSSSTNSSS